MSVCVSVCLSRHDFKNLEKEFVSGTGHGISIISQHGWLHIYGWTNFDEYYMSFFDISPPPLWNCSISIPPHQKYEDAENANMLQMA